MTISVASPIGQAVINPQRFGIHLMIAQGMLFAAETGAIHHIGSGASVMLLAVLRGAGGLILALLLARHFGCAVARTRQLALQLLRGGVSLLYLWVMIYSFGHLPFADATAISYTQGAYIAAFSVVILGESVSRSHWAAAAVGVVGALFIAKPAFAGWNSFYLVALFGTSLNGLAFVLNRYLQQQDSETTTLFYTNVVVVLGSAPALANVGLPEAAALVWLPALFLLGPIGMYLGIVAVRHASTSVLGPYTLLRLVIGLVAGAAIFRELPDISSVVGSALIVASCALCSRVNTSQKAYLRICATLRPKRDASLPPLVGRVARVGRGQINKLAEKAGVTLGY